MSEKGLKMLCKQKLLPGAKSCKLDFCQHCVLGKQHRVSFSVANHTSKDILDYVHSDVWESPEPSMSGMKYYVSFIDDLSRMVWVFFMREKSEVFSIFKKWKTQVETQTGKKVKHISPIMEVSISLRSLTSIVKVKALPVI